LYYATSDGPPGCFRYGFGHDVGCLYEHGDFVKARLADGYGVVAALGTTLRRLRAHLTDIANLEPLALVPLFALRIAKHASRAALGLVALFVLAYAPFYFDGNYPGGGARFFADVLPIEHVLFAVGALAIASYVKRVSYTQTAQALLGLALVGFAVHASFAHRALRDRDAGAPMFDSEQLKTVNLTRGLVFTTNDDGFLLGNDGTTSAKDGVVVARLRHDAHDRVLYERLGKPVTFVVEPHGHSGTRLVVFNVPNARADGLTGWRFESEAEWPPLAQEGGYAIPAWASDSCASGEQVLRIAPTDGATAHVRIALPVPEGGPKFQIAPRFRPTGAKGHAEIRIADARFRFDDLTKQIGADCVTLPAQPVSLTGKQTGQPTGPEESVLIDVSGASIDLDAITVRP
jgi:hypothetical protein